jgi:ADP-ribose pyrophosphatase YjhB (NUDIX family)
MAWITDPAGSVLFVRQAAALRAWTLPGGKVKKKESLIDGLRREVREETGLTAEVGALLAIFDRPDKDTLTLLFAATVNEEAAAWAAPLKQKEIVAHAFVSALPERVTASAKHFWELLSA